MPSTIICHLPPLSSVSLLSLRRAPCDGGVLTGLSHSDATRGKLMCPRLHRSITPCDGTSAFALSRIHRGAGEKIRNKKRARRFHKESLNSYCCGVHDVWVTALGLRLRFLGERVVPGQMAAVNPDSRRSAPGDTKGNTPEPKSQTRKWLNCAARAESQALLVLHK